MAELVTLVDGVNAVRAARALLMRRDVARVRSKSGGSAANPYAMWGCFGDSTTRFDGVAVGGVANSIVKALSTQLRAAGIPANANSFFGQGGPPGATTISQYDPRISTTGTITTIAKSVGGPMVALTAGSTLTFTPDDGDHTTYRIYYAISSGLGTFNAKIDAGTPSSNIATTGSAAINKLDIGGTANGVTTGAHSVTLTHVSGGSVAIIGIVAWDDTRPEICLLQAGWGGSNTSDWNDATAGYGVLAAIAYIAPSLSFVELGINDKINSNTITPAQTTANIAALISACDAVGDVIPAIPVEPNPASATNVNYVNWAGVVTAIKAGIGPNYPLIDSTARAPYAQYAAAGLMTDAFHPNKAGNFERAARRVSMIEELL